MKILVTGGLGFIGSHLVETLLLDSKNEITVVDSLVSESSSRNNMFEGVTYHIEDIRNLEVLDLDTDFDVVYHLAALARIQPSFKDPVKYFSIDSLGTCKVLDHARKCSARVVYAGSSSAYGGPMLNPYAFAKYTGEQLCEMYSKVYEMNTVIARFFNVYGPRQPITGPYATVVGVFQGQFEKDKVLSVTGTGEQRRDFTHVSDIVKGLVALSKINASGNVYNLGTGRNYSINELAKMFEGSEISYVPKRPGEADMTLADITKTTADTGWMPEVNIQDYVFEFIGKK